MTLGIIRLLRKSLLLLFVQLGHNCSSRTSQTGSLPGRRIGYTIYFLNWNLNGLD
jgi:hypothetical protein